MTHIVSFTAQGAALCVRMMELLGADCAGYAPERYCFHSQLQPLNEPVRDWAGSRFSRGNHLVFIGAAGIAVRAVAPHLSGKQHDSAVICVDEAAQFCIPLLSGHLGGANEAAKHLADLIGATAVITTATDVRGCFSPDAWAAQNGCAVGNVEQIRFIAAALLDGEPVAFECDFPVQGNLPQGVCADTVAENGIRISLTRQNRYPHTLWLVPRCLRVGIGCRKDTPPPRLEQFLLQVLQQNGLSVKALAEVATITLKEREPAILALCKKYRLGLHVYTAEQLAEIPGAFTPSEFVLETTGVDNVCERAAVAEDGMLLIRKTTGSGVSIAVAQSYWEAVF